MAWQLIYTSAPRLIEAGRTGFGTVARHRAVSGMLAAAVERFSQFARLPGHDPRRVVHAHRILTVGAGTYHVLSCLQDAGSDYTGRTNHIAHHLIAEPREIRALSAAGLTPADVLLSMAWRSSWSEAPRYLDPSEEVDLSSFTPSATRAWAAVTGDPASAGILWSREALKGCYLILPSGISGLELFRESLLVEPAQAWQTRFTTCLEPNDDLADFRWVALSSTSPMRVHVETSNRLVFDLTSPATLPAPPPREAPPPLIETVSQTTPAPAPLTPSVHDPMRPAGAAPAAVSSMSGWSPEPRRKAAKSNKSFIGISLIIAAVMIVVVVGALLRQNNLQTQARAEYDSEISRTWKEYDLKLEDTRKMLAEQSDLESGKELLKSYVAFFKGMRQLLHQPGTHAQLSLTADDNDELRDLKQRLDEWADLHEKPWANLNPGKDKDAASEILAAYRHWQASRTTTWKQLMAYLSLKGVPPPADDLVQSLKDKAKERLRSTAPERGSRDSWKQLFELPDQKSPVDSQVQRWLTLWEKLDASSYDVAQKAAADTSLPEWLRDQAAALIQQRDKKNKPQMAQVPRQESAAPAKPVVTFEDADAISASNPIYIYLIKPKEDQSNEDQSNEDPADKITGLPVSVDMQLYVGRAWDAHPLPDAKTAPPDNALKKWISAHEENKIKFGSAINSPLTALIQFSTGGTLSTLPKELLNDSDGVRLVARSHDGLQVLFDLRLIPISKVASSPIFTQVIETTVDNADAVTLSLPAGFLSRLHFVGQQENVYSLRLNGAAADQKFYALTSAGDSAFHVMPPQKKGSPVLNRAFIENQIKELEAGILNDDKLLAANEAKKISSRIKDANRESYTKSKSDKELKLQDLRAQLQSLETPLPLHFDLLPGSYTLLLEQPAKIELCRLKVVQAASPSQSKPTNP